MDRKWETESKGQVVLFEWTNFLQYEACEFLAVSQKLDLTWLYSPPSRRESFSTTTTTTSVCKADARAVRDVQYQGDLLEYLKDYDKLQKKAAFDLSLIHI